MENENQKETEEKSIEANDPISQANRAAERLEKANKENRELLARMEKLEANRILGGRSEGAEQVEKKKDMDPLEYSKLALSGKLNK